MSLRSSAFALALLAPLPAFSQTTFLSGDRSIEGNLCVGESCTSTETFTDTAVLRLKDNNVRLKFDDTSTAVDVPQRDWSIILNDPSSSGSEYFAIRDETASNTVFKIEGEAPPFALYVDNNGYIGAQTQFPQRNLHLVGSVPGLAIDDPNGARRWDLWQSSLGLQFLDYSTTYGQTVTRPKVVIFENGAPEHSLVLESGTGNAGLGTSSPGAALHVRRTDGTAAIKVENTSASTSAVREMLNMSNKGGSYFTLANTDSGTTWYFTHEQAAPNRFIITDGVADGPEMTLTADGDLTVQGRFISGSTTLNVPDYVFGPEYALRPLTEVRDFIAENRHLPDIPSAAEIADTGLDMTDMQMRLLRKVEELTLYTLDLEATNRALEARLARLEAAQAAR
ncbi:hypothetical protein [Tropicibacter sp. S64]|uniref:hypothetical protein n=1 Tax=Tropicibacter sp. S64 TaxID=3415122 RepID=UPI003C7E3727